MNSSYHKHQLKVSDQNNINIIPIEFVCTDCCSACVKGKRAVEYCWLLKEHSDDMAGVCINCYKAQSCPSVTQCRQVLEHKGSNALTNEPLVIPSCSEEKNVQKCISSGFTPCCVELVSFSMISVHPDAHTASTPSCKEGSNHYGLGYLVPFTKERWEEWCRK